MTTERTDRTVVTDTSTPGVAPAVRTETRSTSRSGPGASELTRRIVVLLFGLIQVLIGARFVLLLLDAREANGLVTAILNGSQLFVAPFEGILRTDALHALDLVDVAAHLDQRTGLGAVSELGVGNLVVVISTELAGLSQVATLPGFEEAGAETAQAVLEECAKFNEGVIAPLNGEGDKTPSSWRDGVVTTSPGFKDAYRQYAEGGWQGLQHPSEFGGNLMNWNLSRTSGGATYR